MKRYLIGLLAIIGISSSCFAQGFSLEGFVYDQRNQPLEAAHLHIGNHFVLTNAGGYFKINNLPKGGYSLSISFIGFQTYSTSLRIDEDTEVTYILKEDTASLTEVLLTGNTRRISSENKDVVSQAYIQQQFSGSFAKSLEKLPGVNSVEIGAGASKPIIRGLGFNRVAISENGIKQEGQQWGADHGLEIDAFSVERVEVIKGVGAIEHGSDAIGGVIKIINDGVPENGLSGEIIAMGKTINNTIAASTNLAYRKEKFFYKLKATGSEFGDYGVPTDTILYLSRHVPIYNERLKNTAGKEIDLYGQVGYLGDHYKGTLSLSNVYYKSGFFPGAHGIPSIARVQDDGDRRNIDYPFQRVNHFKAIYKNQWFFHHASLDIILGYQNNHRQEWSSFHTHYTGQSAPETNPDLELDFNLNTYDIQAKYTRTFSEKHEGSIGIQNQIQDNTIAGFNFLLPAYNRVNTGIYLTHNYQVSEKIKLNAGARFDYSKISIAGNYDQTLYNYLLRNGGSAEIADEYASRSTAMKRDFTNFNIMGGALYNFGKNWDVSLNTGTSFRLPTAIELGANGIHHGSFRHEQGDPSLDPEKGYVIDTNLNYSKDSFSMSLSPYLYYFDNYIFLNPSGVFSMLPHAGQIYKFTQSEALLTGIELEFQASLFKNIHTQLVLEYLYNRQVTVHRSRNFPLPFTPPVNGFGEISYSLFEDSALLTGTEIFGNISFAMEQSRIAQNEEVTPGYEIFGLGVRTALQIGNFKADLNLQATNLFNTHYYNHTNFYRALEIPEMGRNVQLMLKIPLSI